MTFWSGFVPPNSPFYFQFVCTKPPEGFSPCTTKFKKRHFPPLKSARFSVFRAKKGSFIRFQGKFKSSFCGSQNSFKKFVVLYTIQIGKIVKNSLWRRYFYRGFGGIYGNSLEILRILLEKGAGRGRKKGFKWGFSKNLSKKNPEKQMSSGIF